jgi:hypothetical protein
MAAWAVTLEARLLGGLIAATPGSAGLWFAPRSRCSLPIGHGKVHITLWRRPEGTGRKQPFFIRRKDGRPIGFAGLWECWERDEEAAPIESCAVITTEANELVRPIHNRMPAILRPEITCSGSTRRSATR